MPKDKIHLFLSYSTDNKKIAERIKSNLKKFNFEIFLAHENDCPSLKQQQVILQELKKTDLLLPLLTKEFKASNWTDQELGFALANEKIIVPILISLETPYGFMSNFRAVKYEITNHIKSCDKIFATFIDTQAIGVNDLFNSILFALEDTQTSKRINQLLLLFSHFEELPEYQMRRLIRTLFNKKNALPAEVKKNLQDILKKHSSYINKDIYAELEKNLGKNFIHEIVKLKNIPEGSLIKLENKDQVYLIKDNKKHLVPGRRTFEALGYQWGEVVVASQEIFNKYPADEPMDDVEHAEMIKEKDGSQTYMILEGEKRLIPDQATIYAMQRDCCDVETFNSYEFNSLPTGRPLRSVRDWSKESKIVLGLKRHLGDK